MRSIISFRYRNITRCLLLSILVVLQWCFAGISHINEIWISLVNIKTLFHATSYIWYTFLFQLRSLETVLQLLTPKTHLARRCQTSETWRQKWAGKTSETSRLFGAQEYSYKLICSCKQTLWALNQVDIGGWSFKMTFKISL